MYSQAFDITPSDSVEFTNDTRAIYCGGAGNIVVITTGGDTVTLSGCLAGHIYPIKARRVNSTGTTATNLRGLY